MKEHCTAVILAAGRGTRMGTQTAKQYLELQGKPILAYALEIFEQSAVVDDILLMTDKEHVEYCKKEICEKYGIKKVSAVAPGGKERYESVWKALCILKEREQTGYVMIHDGARPFITEEVLKRIYGQVQDKKACVVGMPVKDTIKLINKDRQITESPDRSLVWQAQTPQAFALPLIIDAFEKQMKEASAAASEAAAASGRSQLIDLGTFYRITEQIIIIDQAVKEEHGSAIAIMLKIKPASALPG